MDYIIRIYYLNYIPLNSLEGKEARKYDKLNFNLLNHLSQHATIETEQWLLASFSTCNNRDRTMVTSIFLNTIETEQWLLVASFSTCNNRDRTMVTRICKATLKKLQI